MTNEQVLEELKQHRIVAIARGIEASQADEAAEALWQGGIRVIEVTLNTPDALSIIAGWRERFAGRLRVGAGTVLDAKMARDALSAGAEFLVSPHVEEEVIESGAQNDAPVLAGALTPTEIVRAWRAGAPIVKVFPAATFGASYFKEVRGPLPQIPLLAVGGINLENLSEFLQAGAIGVGVGSNLVDRQLIESGRFDELRILAARYVQAAKHQ